MIGARGELRGDYAIAGVSCARAEAPSRPCAEMRRRQQEPLPGNRRMVLGSDASALLFGDFYGAKTSRLSAHERTKWRAPPNRPVTGDMDELLAIWTRPSRCLARIHAARTLYAVDDRGRDRSSAIIHRMSANQLRGMATSAIWKIT